jgi:hypothetical protein
MGRCHCVSSEQDADVDAAEADAGDADAGDSGRDIIDRAGREVDCGPAECPDDPVDGPVGTPCVDSLGCATGLYCHQERPDDWEGARYVAWPGGYCADARVGACDAGPPVGPCPDGSRCVFLGIPSATGQARYECQDTCASVSALGPPWAGNCDCRDGYRCDLDLAVCLPGCSNDDECCELWQDGVGGPDDGVRQSAEVSSLPAERCTDLCDPCTFACTLDGCPGGACRVGDPCLHDSECPARSRCVRDRRWGDPVVPGICVLQRCDLDGRDCPPGSACGDFSSASPESALHGPSCVRSCRAGSRPGEVDFVCADRGALGVADAEDHVCRLANPSLWMDGTTADGYCWPGP